MTECNVKYLAVTFFAINLLCALFLTFLLKKVSSFKKLNGQNNMGKDIYKLSMMGSFAYAITSTIVFAIVIGMEIGAGNFA